MDDVVLNHRKKTRASPRIAFRFRDGLSRTFIASSTRFPLELPIKVIINHFAGIIF